MIQINLLKPGIVIYNDSNPGGMIKIKYETEYIINPCFYEILWDKESFNSIKCRERNNG